MIHFTPNNSSTPGRGNTILLEVKSKYDKNTKNVEIELIFAFWEFVDGKKTIKVRQSKSGTFEEATFTLYATVCFSSLEIGTISKDVTFNSHPDSIRYTKLVTDVTITSKSYKLDKNEFVRQAFTTLVATPVATPVTTPVTTPVATPVTTPVESHNLAIDFGSEFPCLSVELSASNSTSLSEDPLDKLLSKVNDSQTGSTISYKTRRVVNNTVDTALGLKVATSKEKPLTKKAAMTDAQRVFGTISQTPKKPLNTKGLAGAFRNSNKVL